MSKAKEEPKIQNSLFGQLLKGYNDNFIIEV